METATDLDESRLTEEREVVAAVTTALAGAGPLTQRLERAIQLLADRLQMVRSRLAELEMEAEPSRGHTVTGRNLQASLVGQSKAMGEVYEAIRRVSGSQATVLLRGESGTGKELVAKAIHLQGSRSRGPFVRLHCAAVTESLLESELFGHERGAFTGAVEQRKGRFELADGGTLFLDEVGDIPPSVQVKLLRVLQDKCFERVGGNRLLSVDVRLISATHRDLEAMVRAGTFREDLYYRLNVVPVTLPPLRARAGDIPLLIEHFLRRFNRENNRHVRLGRDLLALMTLRLGIFPHRARFRHPHRSVARATRRAVGAGERGRQGLGAGGAHRRARGQLATARCPHHGRRPGRLAGGAARQAARLRAAYSRPQR